MYAIRSYYGEEVGRELDGLPGGQGLNIAHEAVDRHADSALKEKIAIRCLGKDGSITDLRYGGLREESNRFANLLRTLGVGKGERIFWLAGRIPLLYATFFGTLKRGCVFCPLFSAFGPEPIAQRLERRNNFV